jgi:hypothetical protein
MTRVGRSAWQPSPTRRYSVACRRRARSLERVIDDKRGLGKASVEQERSRKRLECGRMRHGYPKHRSRGGKGGTMVKVCRNDMVRAKKKKVVEEISDKTSLGREMPATA